MTSKTAVHRPHGTYIWGSCSIVSCQIGQKVGTCLLGRRNSGHFHYKLIHMQVSISFQRKKLHFAKKLTTLLFFNVIVMCIHQSFRLANLNKGGVCVTPIGDSKNETRTRPPTCKISPRTANVYEIKGHKGF